MTNHSLKDFIEVFTLFLIPIGGGIPGGVLLAHSKEMQWPVMLLLYFLSDVVLACVFEPVFHYLRKMAKKKAFLFHFGQATKKTIAQTITLYGNSTSIFGLLLIAIGSDPMTGRTVTYAVGHKFLKGWTIAIIGDLIFFSMLMASTLWLNGILGDGSSTIMIILVLMFGFPILIRKIREKFINKTH